jgi:hypothetical protein
MQSGARVIAHLRQLALDGRLIPNQNQLKVTRQLT